jgi:hypothetical protein
MSSHPGSTRVTCLVCGAETDLNYDIPLKEIKNLSSTSIEALIRGHWREGIEAAARCDYLVDKHLSFPLLEISDVQVAIWKCMWLKFGSIRLVKII